MGPFEPYWAYANEMTPSGSQGWGLVGRETIHLIREVETFSPTS